MAAASINYTIDPEDGWTLVATNPAYLFVKPQVYEPWHVCITAGSAPVAPAQATGTLTFAGNAVADETVTIGSTVYTWKAAAGSALEVTIGANAAASIVNLAAKITSNQTNVIVSATTATTVVITATSPGTAGNAIATTETMTNASWGAATLTGGLNGTGWAVMGDKVPMGEPFEIAASITGTVYVRTIKRTNIFGVITT